MLNPRPQIAGLAATGDRAIAAAAKLFPYSPQDQDDQREEADEMSFQALLDARDEASEAGDWLKSVQIDDELRWRRSDAVNRLMARFIEAIDGSAFILIVSGGHICAANTREYLAEVLGTNEGTELAVRMVLSPAGRAEVITRLAAEYARENVEDLLRAGWSVQ